MLILFVLRIELFLHADVFTAEDQAVVESDYARSEALVVTLFELLHGEVCADDGRLFQRDARINHIVDCCRDVRRRDFHAEVVDDEQVAVV